jgi:hypothetical protein
MVRESTAADVIDRAGAGTNEHLSFQDDMEFFSRVISWIETIRFCPEAVFVYRQGVPGSVSNTPGRGSSESQWLATALAVQHLLSVRNTASARVAAVRQLIGQLCSVFGSAGHQQKSRGICEKRGNRPVLASLATRRSQEACAASSSRMENRFESSFDAHDSTNFSLNVRAP